MTRVAQLPMTDVHHSQGDAVSMRAPTVLAGRCRMVTSAGPAWSLPVDGPAAVASSVGSGPRPERSGKRMVGNRSLWVPLSTVPKEIARNVLILAISLGTDSLNPPVPEPLGAVGHRHGFCRSERMQFMTSVREESPLGRGMRRFEAADAMRSGIIPACAGT